MHWTLRQDMTEALEVLGKDQRKHETAANVLIGIERTDSPRALEHLQRHRRCARRLQRRRDESEREGPELRPQEVRAEQRHDLHHRTRGQAGAVRTVDRRIAGADTPRRIPEGAQL